MSQQRQGPQVPVEQPGRTGKKGCDSQKSGGQYVAVFVRSPNHLSHSKTFRNPFELSKWEVYFSKELFPFVIIIVLNMYVDVYVLCGYTTRVVVPDRVNMGQIELNCVLMLN